MAIVQTFGGYSLSFNHYRIWENLKPKSYLPKAKEICVAGMPDSLKGKYLLIKWGDGKTYFDNLPWVVASTTEILRIVENEFTAEPQDIGAEDADNKVFDINEFSTNTQYPSAKAVYNFINEALEKVEKISNKVDNIVDNNTTLYPSNQAIINKLEELKDAQRDNIDEILEIIGGAENE